MKNVVVTGASGFVGTELCKELVENGYKVKAIYRDESKTSELKKLGVELIKADICDKDSLDYAFSEVQVVFHIAALFRQAKNPDSVYYDVKCRRC